MFAGPSLSKACGRPDTKKQRAGVSIKLNNIATKQRAKCKLDRSLGREND